MANFPISYAERLPSGQSGAVRANLDVDTGGRAIAQGFFQFSGMLQDVADNIYKQEAAAEFSEGKRKIEEKMIAAANAISGDEQADGKIWETLEADLDTVQYKKPGVDAALQAYINEQMPNVKDTLQKSHLAIKKRNAHDKFTFEFGETQATGRLDESKKILDLQLASKNISETEYASRIKTLIPDSLLAQASRLAVSDNPEERKRAEKILANLPNLKNADGSKYEISTEKLDYRNNLLKALKQKSRQDSDEAEIAIITGMDENGKKTIAEKMALGRQYITQLQQTDISGPRYEDMYAKIKNWMSGNDGSTDWSVYKQIFDMTIPVRKKEQTADAVWQKLFENLKNLSTREFTSLKEEIEQAVKYTPSETTGPYVRTAVDTVKSYTNKTADMTDLDIVLDIQERINTLYQSGDKTPEQIESLTKQLLKPYREKEAEKWWAKIWEKAWPWQLPIGFSIPIYIKSLITNEPKNLSEFDKQREDYITQGNMDAAIKYDARWRSKFE